MSSSLCWEPVKGIANRTLPTALKFALRKRFGEPVRVVVSNSTVPYLEGLRDAGVEGAEKLIDLIEKHGEINLNEEY